MEKKYKVITLCGSTKFKKEFQEVQKKLTLEGNIVISVGLFGHSGDSEVWENKNENTLTETKKMLDDMHGILERAFSPNYAETLDGSVALAMSFGVPSNDLLQSISDIDNYFMRE